MIKGHIDSLPCPGKIFGFSHFDRNARGSSLSSDLMKGSDSGRIGTGDNSAGGIDEIDIIAADVCNCVDNLLGESMADVKRGQGMRSLFYGKNLTGGTNNESSHSNRFF